MLSIAWRIVLFKGFGLEGETIRKRIVYIMRWLCLGTWILALISLGSVMSSNAGVTVIQNVAPGATSWPGSPFIRTMLNPSSATVGQTFTNSGSGFTTIGQTFTVTSTNYILQSIDIYAGGGLGTGSGANVTLNLFDLGYQVAPNPTPYSRQAYKDIIGGNLFGSGAGLAIIYANQVNGILEFDFTGADQVLLQVGHMYVFELQTSVRTNVIYWLSVTNGNPYTGGAAYTNKYWLNASSSCDFSMAVYGSVTATIPTAPIPQSGSCTVNGNDIRQRIDGFGASSAFRGTGFSTAQADMLFSTNTGIALSLLRNQVQAGGFASSAEIGIMQQAIARGARVWSAPWSPQASFKTPQIANGGNFDSANNQAYANQLASYVVMMKNQGIDLYALSVQNEPDITNSTYATCWWTAQQISNFVPYLHDALVASNVDSTRIMISESFQWQNHTGLYTTAMDDPNIAAMVGVIADHNYDGIPPDPPTGTPAAIPNYGKALWETEVAVLDPSGSTDSSMQNGIYWAGRIHAFLTVAQANAWHYWWLIYGNTTPNQGLTDISSSVLAKRGYVLGNYSRFVRPNFYRMGVVTNSGPAMVSAYRATNSSAFAIVAINANQTNSINESFNLSNFAATSVTPWVTTSTLSLSNQAAVAITNAAFSYQLPPLSVVTFVGQASPPNLTGSRQGESLVLSWPTNASGFGLEYSTSVAGGSWVPFPAAPTLSGTNFMVTSGLSNDAGFFRLRKP
jgi:glucuronoarabinoxylan endo-1,4-beta-xylanase